MNYLKNLRTDKQKHAHIYSMKRRPEQHVKKFVNKMNSKHGRKSTEFKSILYLQGMVRSGSKRRATQLPTIFTNDYIPIQTFFHNRLIKKK